MKELLAKYVKDGIVTCLIDLTETEIKYKDIFGKV